MDLESEWASGKRRVQMAATTKTRRSFASPALRPLLLATNWTKLDIAHYTAGGVIRRGWLERQQPNRLLTAEQQLLCVLPHMNDILSDGEVLAMHEGDTLRNLVPQRLCALDAIGTRTSFCLHIRRRNMQWSGADIAFTCLRGDLTIEEERTRRHWLGR